MPNWFQEHPSYTIIGHTILVATTTWLVSSYAIDESKVNLYKAKAENADAISEQYKAKVSVLELELSRLKAENERYLSWLVQDPKSIPALENKIKALENDLTAAKAINESKPISETSREKPKPLPYVFSGSFLKGGSFVDPKTKATLGISDISPDYTATGVLYLPGDKFIDLKYVKPGATWRFQQGNIWYQITLNEINWINNSLKASVIEVNSPETSP